MVVDAGLIVGELPRRQRRAVRQFVAGHVCGIGVAARARRRHVGGEDGRLGVGDEPDAVGAVAADAGGDLGVAGREPLAVRAGRILGRLVDTLLGRVAAHQLGVAMAARAGGDDLGAGRLALVALRRVVRLRLDGRGGVAAMAIGAGEAALAMDVLLREERGGSGDARVRLRRVARQARIHGRRGLRLRAGGDRQQQKRRRDRATSHTAPRS